MFILSSDKDQRRNPRALSLSVNEASNPGSVTKLFHWMEDILDDSVNKP